ncbi:cytochrome P450 [Flavisphingomonas formosensis]|uniref:cytochrome P450 n=1 Tax=Flavisphingomonas formosensis TaxID=861534 RepID=UPI0012F902B5|nr:cytochrome P450 [Sphingomonas formosensis]
MVKARKDVTVDFDPLRPAQIHNLDVACAELRHTCPVAWSEAQGGFWVVTRYEDVEKIGRQSKFFSVTGGNTLPPAPYETLPMAHYDPPAHTPYRRGLNPGMSPQAIQDHFLPRIRYWTDVFIDRVIESGFCEAVYDFAVAIPTAVTMEWLGWEDQDEWWQLGKAWHDMQGRPVHSEAWASGSRTVLDFDTRIREELIKRRKSPRDDEMSRILSLEIDGNPMPVDHAVGLIRVLIGAGVDTTTSSIGTGLVHMHFHPEDRQRLIDDPALWPAATEEFLRRYPPSRALVRTCVQETELGDCIIKPGELIYAPITSANQDRAVFASPLSFDMTRKNNRHLSFGTGVHMCLGMHLARAEVEVVLRRVVERMPDYRIIEEGLLEYSRQSTINGWMKAPMAFPPGKRELPDIPEMNLSALTY